MAFVKRLEMIDISMDERFCVKYEKHSFLGIISWWVKIKEDSQGKDLVIMTNEHYDRIILNGKIIAG